MILTQIAEKKNLIHSKNKYFPIFSNFLYFYFYFHWISTLGDDGLCSVQFANVLCTKSATTRSWANALALARNPKTPS